MITKQRCRFCASRFKCSHQQDTSWSEVSGPKQSIDYDWPDERHLNEISLGEGQSNITDPLAMLNAIAAAEKNNDTAKKTMSSTNTKMVFEKCNFCGIDTAEPFLTRHIGIHISNKHIEESTNIRVADSNIKSTSTNLILPKEELIPVSKDDVRKFLNALPMSKLKDAEDFSFRKIKEVSAYSGTSKDGRYSDFTLLIWFTETVSTYNGGFIGTHSSYYSKGTERLQIHLTYDSVENYYTISGRVYKKNSYSDYETEEAAIPDRLCYQEDIKLEIKRICLFFKVSPKIAYKKFIKTLRKGCSFISDNNPKQTISLNYSQILDDLKKGKHSSPTHDPDDYSGYCG